VTEPVNGEQLGADDDDAEVVDALPVPEAVPLHEVPPAPVPARTGGLTLATPVAVQAAAVAVTGFAAGAATVAVVRRRRARKALRGGRKERKLLGEVRASRSFLVDIHLLDRG
jgi:hypothetical protein